MDLRMDRRGWMQVAGVASAALSWVPTANALPRHQGLTKSGDISGRLTGAQAVVATLQQHNVGCVFGIPGAQENELWDALKAAGLRYLLVTHEFSAACMADGYARSTGCPGVIALVPGPGLTNSLTGLGEALLDSIPIVALIGDVGNGNKAHPFQVHSLDQAALLRPVTKEVISVQRVEEIPGAIQQAFVCAQAGEPGPVGVVIPYNLLIEAANFRIGPPTVPSHAWDQPAVDRAIQLLSNRKLKVGIYAGQGCMAYSQELTQLAELLQAPVSTSISGKGAISETHPLAVGWGYGPQATATAESIFDDVDCLLAIGVRYSEVSTGYYSNPRPTYLIHVDANPNNLGRVLRADVCVHADAGLFCSHALSRNDCLQRPRNGHLCQRIQKLKQAERNAHAKSYGKCGVDPMCLIRALRNCLDDAAQLFVDVCLAEHLAAEAFTTCQPRTYFCPTDNQSMGWSIPAALGAQVVNCSRTVATLTGDGCFLMSAMEISTAARVGLPVKFFVLDNQTYRYMQELQLPAYLQTTATILANLDYAALAKGFGVAYQEITPAHGLNESVQAALAFPGPVLVRVCTDYGDRPIRWIEAVRKKYTKELSLEQKTRFMKRIGKRAMDFKPAMND